ncbi:P-loop containing nucleoside triphosphate hydrolase protein [Thelephora ganbajun]|uniref:P-loop containing nucleoside triphosphate hydrolase protein n=1 Tax=Thelephora ganbajun TaxID=370292 RepID=A0ACB6ZLW3_THEGA|nr:P-loop containing nucleoside triphosphate hydrolase protein [Thelephora ganbajun]
MRWRLLTLRVLRLRHAHTSAPKRLRPYQETCLESCLDALKGGSTKIGVSLPTGAGKTVVFVSLLERLHALSTNPEATRSLVIVNSIELARQAADQARKHSPHWTVEIEQGARYTASGLADVTVATFQTLLRTPRLQKFDPAGLKAIIVDEAHHAAAPSYRHILSHFNSSIKNPHAVKDAEDETAGSAVAPTKHSVPIIGFSATFSRHDGLALGSVFDRIVYHRDFLDMIKEQWLCNVRFTCVQADINLKEVTINSATGDYNPTSLANVINTETLNSLVVQTWLDKSNDRKSTLVFCVNLSHVRELTQTFRDAGIDARYVHSKTPAAERKLLVEGFKAGEYPVLVNCAILTEGADVPNIDCVIVARPTRSRNVMVQMIGRGMRLSPETGKKDCQIIDFVDIAGRAPGLVSTPTLFGLDPSEVVDDESLESLEERAQEQTKEVNVGFAVKDANASLEVPSPESVTYVDYDNPFAFIGECCGTTPIIHQLSPLAWVSVGGETYILECVGAGFIRVQPLKDPEEPEAKFQAYYIPATRDKATAKMFKLSPYLRPRHIMRAQNLEQAIRGSDLYAKNTVVKGPRFHGLMRRAKWRKQPATENQKTFVASRWNKAPKYAQGETTHDAAHSLRIQKLTKGEAANVITRIKHGAMSRYEYKMKAMKKEEQLLLKELRRQAREVVTVGPLTTH